MRIYAELCGLAFLTWGFALAWLPLGFIAAGLSVMFIANAFPRRGES